jgi:multidrug transporter EmrE-like cation transporter
MDKLFPISVALVLTFIGVIGDYFLKRAGSGDKYIDVTLFSIGFVLIALTSVGWFYVFKHIKFSTVGAIYGVGAIVYLAVIGVVVFGERLTPYEVVGIVAGILSIVLLVRFA